MSENQTARQLLAQYKAEVRKKAERERAIAKSKTAEAEKKREAQRAKKAKKLAETLTKNLPDADKKYRATKLDKKKLRPFFQSIIDQSQLAGKLKSTKDPDRFMAGFTNSQPKNKLYNFREKDHSVLL
ncbi:MAG: hypothetical protein H2058_13550 [Muricauda sp.]|nr:hypothetical protein [Allomuricauda sp.]MBA4746274.1 hypothetical protein [Allomuricauda sp.]